MGNPSDGKVYPPDEYCIECGTILIGDKEKEMGLCSECENSKDDTKVEVLDNGII